MSKDIRKMSRIFSRMYKESFNAFPKIKMAKYTLMTQSIRIKKAQIN